MKNIILLCIISIAIISSCAKKSSDCPRVFSIPAEILPYSATYKIGDTITITSNFYKFVYDQQTKKEYNMDNIDWNPLFQIHKIDTIVQDSQNLRYETHNYINVIQDGKYNYQFFYFSSGNSNLVCNYKLEQDTYKLEIKFIPKIKGIFYLKFGSGLVMSNQDFEGKCKHTGFDVYTDMNENKDNNIDILKESPNLHYNDWILQKPDERFDRGGGYCYKVVE